MLENAQSRIFSFDNIFNASSTWLLFLKSKSLIYLTFPKKGTEQFLHLENLTVVVVAVTHQKHLSANQFISFKAFKHIQ